MPVIIIGIQAPEHAHARLRWPVVCSLPDARPVHIHLPWLQVRPDIRPLIVDLCLPRNLQVPPTQTFHLPSPFPSFEAHPQNTPNCGVVRDVWTVASDVHSRESWCSTRRQQNIVDGALSEVRRIFGVLSATKAILIAQLDNFSALVIRGRVRAQPRDVGVYEHHVADLQHQDVRGTQVPSQPCAQRTPYKRAHTAVRVFAVGHLAGHGEGIVAIDATNHVVLIRPQMCLLHEEDVRRTYRGQHVGTGEIG
uniref:Uncharacterized protein n=1 Tax=Mycena chlorophos TaxID=658473 RepID=A0ABQ0LFC2_MYCCL|nr:predicted protein [Mycena chlorophos]